VQDRSEKRPEACGITATVSWSQSPLPAHRQAWTIPGVYPICRAADGRVGIAQAQHQTMLHATSDALQSAALKAQSDAQTKQMHAAKMEYHENKKAKGALRAKMAKLKAVEPKDEATHKLLADTKAKLKTLYQNGADLKAKFQSLYSIKFGGSRFSYTNNPTKPGVSASNDGGMYTKYGFGVNPVGWENFQDRGDNAQHCEVMTEGMPQCADVEMSGTCQDMPSYYDCDGDGCAYYTDFPEECGLHDNHCGDDENLVSFYNCDDDLIHMTCHACRVILTSRPAQENPCHSAGHSSEGCCACQHHGTDSGTWTCPALLQSEPFPGVTIYLCINQDAGHGRLAPRGWRRRRGLIVKAGTATITFRTPTAVTMMALTASTRT